MAAKNLTTLTLIASLLFLPAVAQSSVPFETEQTLVVITAVIDGHSKRMLFDTGSMRTMVYGRHTQFEREVSISVGGKSRTVPVIFVDVSNMSRNVVAAIQTVNADGILGQDFMRQFASVRIDYKTKQIELQ